MGQPKPNKSQMIKVLIIGLGSIGQRHAEALKKLNISQIAALRTKKGQKDVLPMFDDIEVFNNEEDAFNWCPTHLIISNPTSLHMHFVKIAIEKSIKFFVEKPISDNLREILALERPEKVNGVVGYNLRFHGLFRFIKGLINNNTYGKVISAQLHVGQYLPSWHPYEDYRDAYYSKKELGGGALRTLSHEVDLMQYFFGDVVSLFAKVQKNSDLEIDVDDVTNILAQTTNCPQVTVHINLLDPNIKRQGNIYFSKGVLEYDFMKSKVSFISNKGEETVLYSEKEDLGAQYEFQMKEFLYEQEPILACTFSQGISVMQIIEKCEQSNNEKKEICLI